MTPGIQSSTTTQEEFDRNIRYAKLVTSVANMIPGYTIVTPLLQHQSLPDEAWVTNPFIAPWARFQHCADGPRKLQKGWRNNSTFQVKADQIWYTVDIPGVKASKVEKKVSVANIHLLTDDTEIIDFVQSLTKESTPQLNYIHGEGGGIVGGGVIDLCTTVLHCHEKGYTGEHQVVFSYL
jgi:hypothetical protein